MADQMNVPKPKSVPKFIIRIVLGKLMSETITMNCRVSNAKAKIQLCWDLKYPSFKEWLPYTLKTLAAQKNP